MEQATCTGHHDGHGHQHDGDTCPIHEEQGPWFAECGHCGHQVGGATEADARAALEWHFDDPGDPFGDDPLGEQEHWQKAVWKVEPSRSALPTHHGDKFHTVYLSSAELSTIEHALLIHSVDCGRRYGPDSQLRADEIALRDKLLRLTGRRDLRAQ